MKAKNIYTAIMNNPPLCKFATFAANQTVYHHAVDQQGTFFTKSCVTIG